jgi:carbon-monoxide dehydrogenase medium subunit
MIPAAFDYRRATSVDDALAQLAGGAKAIAGGQSLLSFMKLRLAQPDRLVDIGGLAELKGTRDLPDGGYEIGALTTYAEIIEATKLEWAREAVRHIADVQVRNRGTIGGAIAHADPGSDVPAILIALGYSAVLRSGGGERVVSLDEFFEGPFQTGIKDDEILVSLRRGPLPPGAGGAYEKLAQPASGYALVGIAAVVARSGGTVSHARIGVAGVHEHTYRADTVEQALVGTDGSADAIATAAAHVTDDVEVASDIHAGRDYRTAMAVVYTRRAIETALGRAG